MISTCARMIVRGYPRRWRDRYGAEVLGLLDDGRASWGQVADLIAGCASEWVQMLLRPDTDGVFKHTGAILGAVVVIGLAIDLASFGVVRLWQVVTVWTPPALAADMSRAIPVVTLVAVLLSGMGGRRVRLRAAWIAMMLTVAGAILDRLRLEPTGIGYGVKSMLWIGIVLTWDEVRRGPYRSRPPLGLRS